jgi:8-oxo-dGTP pyrophosphatase MutT (NUDIX family)
MIEAAGGVVWREGGDGVEVVVVHRPRYDDWSFPKGKLDKGETFEQAARREVEEETGIRCSLGEELPEVRYADRNQREKRVRYWRMQPERGTFAPNEEVDEMRWLPVAAARKTLTYERDREVLDDFARQ